MNYSNEKTHYVDKHPSRSGWLKLIAQNSDYWYEDVIDTYPSVISYEYKNLRDLCCEEEPYGVLLSIKDNYETFLKLEVLLSYAWASNYVDKPAVNSTIALLTTPNLSLGSWMELALLLKKALGSCNIQLPKAFPLEKIRKQYIKKGVVNWRNSRIGHGAMGMSDDEEFQKDLTSRIISLKEIFASVDSFLKNQELYLKTTSRENNYDDSYFLSLTGYKYARGLEADGEVCFRTRDNDIDFCVNPFIIIRKHEKKGRGVYFFDNQRTSSLTHFLSYSDGKLYSENTAYFEMLRKDLETLQISLDAKIDDIYLTEKEIAEIDSIQMSHEFVKPLFLINWLNSCVAEYDKGVLLLQMERGTGKSVFTEKLNSLGHKSVNLSEDIDIRTYHFGRSQKVGTMDVLNSIEWLWRTDYNGRKWEREPRIHDFVSDGIELNNAFSRFLGEVRKYTERNRGCTKIMMVFDGLDEISEEILWDIIPSSEMLDDGVYVLLTSRIFQEEPITNNVKKHLASLPVKTTFIINRDSDEYRQFLYSYILTTNVGSMTEKEMIQLVSIADYRVLHLGMLCKLLENGLLLEDLHHYNRVFPAYLMTLNHRYGERGSIYVRELLATICILGMYEPLTIKDIGNLIGENGVTLKLVGALRDVAPVLKEERSQNGNVYVISNPDLNDEVRHHIPEIYDVAKELLQIGVSYLLEETPITPTTITEETGVELIIAHIFDFTLAFCPDQISILNNKIVNSLKDLCVSLLTFSKSLKDRQFALQFAIQAYNISDYCNGSDSPSTWEIMELLIYLYRDIEDDTNRNALINKLYLSKKETLGFNNAETLAQYAIVISQQEDIDSFEKTKQLREVYEKIISIIGHDTQESIGILDLIAHELFKVKKFDEALRLGREVYEKRVSILGPEHPETLDAMYNLSIEYNKTGQQSKALELLYSAYEKQKTLPSGFTLGSSKELASIARIFIEIGYLDGAIDVFRDAYQHEIALLGKEHSETIKTGEDLALALESANKYEEALAVMEDIYISKESKYGKNSEICLETMDYIGSLYMEYGNYIERILPAQNIFHKKQIKQNTTSEKNADYNTFYVKSCNIKESVFKSSQTLLGENHYLTLKYLSGLGKAKLYSGDYPEAYKLLSFAFLKQSGIWGKYDDETLITMESLAFSAFKVKKYDEAISLQREVFEQLKQKESGAEELYYSISRLINIYNEAHKEIDQATWDEYKNRQKTYFLQFDKEHFPTSWERFKTTVSSLKEYGPYVE